MKAIKNILIDKPAAICGGIRRFAGAVLLLAAVPADAFAYGVIGASSGAQGSANAVVVAVTNFFSYADAEEEWRRQCESKAPRANLCRNAGMSRFINEVAFGASRNDPLIGESYYETARTASENLSSDERAALGDFSNRNLVLRWACGNVAPGSQTGDECDERIYVIDTTVCPAGSEIGPESCVCMEGMEPDESTPEPYDCRPIPVVCEGATPILDDTTGECRARTVDDCADGEVVDDTTGECRLRAAHDCAENERFFDGVCEIPLTRADCPLFAGGTLENPHGALLNPATNRCECFNGAEATFVEVFEDISNIDTVFPRTPEEAWCVRNEYFADIIRRSTFYGREECEQSGWRLNIFFSYHREGPLPLNARVWMVCDIPYELRDTAPPLIQPAASAQSAGNISAQNAGLENDLERGCVLNELPENSPVRLRTCASLYGNVGLPEKPADFPDDLTAAHKLIIVETESANSANRVINPLSSKPVARATETAFSIPGGGGGSGSGGGGDRGEVVLGVGAAAFVGLAVYGLWDGNPNAFTFSPEHSFSLNEKTAAYSYGSRLDFAQDEWTAYWGATRAHRGGVAQEWRYFTGMTYGGELWSASFDAVNYNDETSADMGLSANYASGIWRWHGGVNADYSIDKLGEKDAAAYFNAGAVLDYNGWQLKPAANLYWREGKNFGDDASFRIELRRGL